MAKKSIGEANIKLTAEGTDQVASKLKEVKADLEATASAGDDAGNKINEGFRKAGSSVEGATSGIRKFAGSISGVLGIVSGLTAAFAFAFGRIVRNINDATEANESLIASIKGTREAQRGIADEYERSGKKADDFDRIREESNARILALIEESNKAEEKLNELLEKRSGLLQILLRGRDGIAEADRIAADTSREINERLAVDIQRVTEERDRRLAELAQERADEQVKIAEESARREEEIVDRLARQLESVRISGLDGADRADAEYQQRRADRERAYQEAVEAGRTREAELLAAIDAQDAENTRNAINRVKEQQRAREEAEKQRAEQDQSRAEAQAQRELTNAIKELQRSVQDSANKFNENTRAMERLTRDHANFTRAVQRVGDGVRK